MKRLILLALLGLWTSSASAAQAHWLGQFFIKAVDAKCAGGVGQHFTVRFQPPVTPDNGPDSNIVLFQHERAIAFRLPNDSFDDTFRVTQFRNIFEVDSLQTSVKIRFTQAPANITPALPFLHIVGEIKGWNFDADCTATFNMSLTKEPNF